MGRPIVAVMAATLLAMTAMASSARAAAPIPWRADLTQPPGATAWRLTDAPHGPEGRWLAASQDAASRSGALEVTSGCWESPLLAVTPHAYYRVTFRARSEAIAHWSPVFFDGDGRNLVVDNYDGVDPAAELTTIDGIVRTPQTAAQMVLRFRPTTAALTISDIAVDAATTDDAAAGSQRIIESLPKLVFRPPADRWTRLLKTRERLAAGKPLRVVMLGDSICNDTSNSLFEVTVARRWRQADGGAMPSLQVVTSVRGATGCDYYAQAGRVQRYVLDHQPDLLIIAGVSNGPEVEPVRDVIRQVRRARAQTEVLVLTGAIMPASVVAAMQRWCPEATRGRPPGNPNPEVIASIKAMKPLDAAQRVGMVRFSREMQAISAEEGVAFLDMRRAWDEFIQAQDRPIEHYLRDPYHANHRGKEIVGRILAEYLSP